MDRRLACTPRDYGNFDVSFNMARLGVAGRWFTEIGLGDRIGLGMYVYEILFFGYSFSRVSMFLIKFKSRKIASFDRVDFSIENLLIFIRVSNV